MENSKYLYTAIALIVGLIIGGSIGFFSFQFISTTPIGGRRLKAGFIYVGPIGDIGWTHAHDYARNLLIDKFDWLDTDYIESVPEGEAGSYINNLIDLGSDVIFTTSFGYMDPTLTASNAHTDKLFFHCSGYKRNSNMGTYFAEFYQLYYLNGIIAGALTETDHLGYVAAYLIPEVVRHLDAFILGARVVNPNAKLYVKEILGWYNPTEARNAAEDLIAFNDVDVLCFTEDSSPTTKLLSIQEEPDPTVSRSWSKRN